MGKVVEKKKRKKGRPSLLDIQKRRLQQEQEEEEQQQRDPKRNPSFTNTNPNLNHSRFTRRNPNPDDDANVNESDDDDEGGIRREKKLNHLLETQNQHLNSQLYASDYESNGESQLKKRRINDGSAADADGFNKKDDEGNTFSSKATDSGPTTPLPDKKLLVFILDGLQKKDTYSVFSEPVDPEELPDYHELIEHPMDFGTVRKKLDSGAYANLEQFENDVLLISSNAMEYNAPDTIYFRQARSIQELAKKNFENLRQDSDDNEPVQPVEPKRRGRPPKNLQRTVGKATSGFTSDANKGGESSILSNSYSLRRGLQSNKYSSTEASRRPRHGFHNGETYSRLSSEHKSDRNDEFPAYLFKGSSTKYGKSQFMLDENRRDTYMNPLPSVLGSEPSVLTAFDGEQKQLMPVGFHTDYGYARSMARFAANLGPIAWKVASKKIASSLPPGVKFGPGWVGEPEEPLLQRSVPSPPQQLQTQHSIPSIDASASPTRPQVESKGDGLVKQEFRKDQSTDELLNRILQPSASASPSLIVNRSLEPAASFVETERGLNTGNINGSGSINGGIRPPFQFHQSSVYNHPMNGLGFNNPSSMGKLVGPSWSAGTFSSEPSIHSRVFDMVSKNSFVNPMPTNRVDSDNTKLSGNSSILNSGSSSSNPLHAQTSSVAGQHSRQGAALQQKPDTIPPNLNLRFQSSGSPSSSVRVDSPQPDLALQL